MDGENLKQKIYEIKLLVKDFENFRNEFNEFYYNFISNNCLYQIFNHNVYYLDLKKLVVFSKSKKFDKDKVNKKIISLNKKNIEEIDFEIVDKFVKKYELNLNLINYYNKTFLYVLILFYLRYISHKIEQIEKKLYVNFDVVNEIDKFVNFLDNIENVKKDYEDMVNKYSLLKILINLGVV
ncbi:MAG: hypothetical protein NC926_08015 [Candidatus Omnitrophica bacterium]|nr:hypothetical protein [Candidatus Omnitrophota bacterium]